VYFHLQLVLKIKEFNTNWLASSDLHIVSAGRIKGSRLAFGAFNYYK